MESVIGIRTSRASRTRLALFAAVGLVGCFSLPPPDPASKALVGAQAPGFSLPSTGPTPRKLGLADLTSGTTAVLVFYRGHW
jgi:hypothetical protein